MGAAEISQFLTWLAVDRQISASTQNQALSALLFLYRAVLTIEISAVPPVVRASAAWSTNDQRRTELDGSLQARGG
jgi:hypothetical protein